MPQVKTRIKTGKPESKFDEVLERELLSYTYALADLLNQGLTFADNFNAQILSHTSNAVADTEDTIAHTLQRVPVGYLVFYQDKAGQLYQGPSTGTAWTSSNFYLKCTVASVTFQIIVF